MLEQFVVFNKGGLILWSYTFEKPKGEPVNDLIQTILIEERSGLDSFSSGQYALRWILANDVDLVFVAVTQKSIAVPYLDELLMNASQAFLDQFGGQVRTIGKSFAAFDKKFDAIHQEARTQSKEKKADGKKPRSFYETEKGKKLVKEGKAPKNQNKKPKKPKNPQSPNANDEEEDEEEDLEESESKSDTEAGETGSENVDNGTDTPTAVTGEPSGEAGSASPQPEQSDSVQNSTSSSSPDLDQAKVIEETKQRFIRNQSTKLQKKPSVKEQTSPPPKKGSSKVLQSWGKASKEEAAALNFSSDKHKSDAVPRADDPNSPDALGAKEKINLTAFTDLDSDSEEEDAPQKASGGFMSFFTSITNKELTDKDLAPVLEQFRDHLIGKNVARDIAEQLCQSVQSSLVGKTHSNFRRISTTVKESMEAALTRILTPKRSIDVLREARAAKQEGRPYSIVFVGVNGVGKSTTLAKVCSWLQQNDLKVMIAACDTFRSGAVEQLQVHARNLEVPLHHRGYGKDAASIAMEGIQKAQREGRDVVLVDTAGRMQDNEPLMKALAKLVGVNNPDLVLFVGEALVGNDSVDQLTKFNRAMIDFGNPGQARGIDGIILTKFDTVDDKVGAAISMVYSTGLPIVFLGIGQKYSDLRIIDIKRVVQILMKGHL